MRTKTINVVLEDGTPFGLKTVKLSNWQGTMVVCPRSSLGKIKDLEIQSLPAVYLLVNADVDKVYVGETDELLSRMKSHDSTKDFWEILIAFVSPDLSKTEVKLLEHLLIRKIKEDGRVDLVNLTVPKEINVLRNVRDIADEFLEKVVLLLNSLGFSLLGTTDELLGKDAKTIEVFCKGPDANAVGRFSEDGLVVLMGSLCRKKFTGSAPAHSQRLQQVLIENGILIEEGESQYRFTKDYVFKSPSGAADLVLARSSDGWTDWKDKTGKSLYQLVEKQK